MFKVDALAGIDRVALLDANVLDVGIDRQQPPIVTQDENRDLVGIPRDGGDGAGRGGHDGASFCSLEVDAFVFVVSLQ